MLRAELERPSSGIRCVCARVRARMSAQTHTSARTRASTYARTWGVEGSSQIVTLQPAHSCAVISVISHSLTTPDNGAFNQPEAQIEDGRRQGGLKGHKRGSCGEGGSA